MSGTRLAVWADRLDRTQAGDVFLFSEELIGLLPKAVLPKPNPHDATATAQTDTLRAAPLDDPSTNQPNLKAEWQIYPQGNDFLMVLKLSWPAGPVTFVAIPESGYPYLDVVRETGRLLLCLTPVEDGPKGGEQFLAVPLTGLSAGLQSIARQLHAIPWRIYPELESLRQALPVRITPRRRHRPNPTGSPGAPA